MENGKSKEKEPREEMPEYHEEDRLGTFIHRYNRGRRRGWMAKGENSSTGRVSIGMEGVGRGGRRPEEGYNQENS